MLDIIRIVLKLAAVVTGFLTSLCLISYSVEAFRFLYIVVFNIKPELKDDLPTFLKTLGRLIFVTLILYSLYIKNEDIYNIILYYLHRFIR